MNHINIGTSVYIGWCVLVIVTMLVLLAQPIPKKYVKYQGIHRPQRPVIQARESYRAQHYAPIIYARGDVARYTAHRYITYR
jgi:hypothetical protein